jgi:hypothetical protein
MPSLCRSSITAGHRPVQHSGTPHATRADYASLLERKRAARAADERRRPLESYRAEELALMRLDIFDDRRGFAAARHAFVTKQTRSPGRDTQTRSHLVSRPGPAAA